MPYHHHNIAFLNALVATPKKSFACDIAVNLRNTSGTAPRHNVQIDVEFQRNTLGGSFWK